MSQQNSLLGTLQGFLHPISPRKGEEYPQAFVEALVVHSLKRKDIPDAQSIIAGIIVTALSGVGGFGNTLTWNEVDQICAEALSFYIRMSSCTDIGWVERDTGILAFCQELYWKIPDRIEDQREEPTNCTSYVVTERCMPKTKEILFQRVVGTWNISPHDLNRDLSRAAFAFLCEVFEQGKRDGRKTTDKNVRIMKRYVTDERRLIAEDAKMLVALLEEHCKKMTLADARVWMREDLPDAMFALFQEALIRSGDRSLIRRLIQESAVK